VFRAVQCIATGGGIHPVMALSDYMPFGAPELLDGASPRMAGSTFIASTLVAAVVCCLGLVTANRSVVTQVPACFGPLADNTLRQFVILEPPPPAPRSFARSFNTQASDFRPVDTDPPAIVTFDEPASIGHETSTPIGEPEALGGDGNTRPVPDPLPDAYVYTDELPQLARAVKPSYPDIAREAGVEGTVRLKLLVGLDGHVMRAIVRSGGSVPMLDEAAIAAALASMFTPALANKRAVEVWVAQDYVFKLH